MSNARSPTLPNSLYMPYVEIWLKTFIRRSRGEDPREGHKKKSFLPGLPARHCPGRKRCVIRGRPPIRCLLIGRETSSAFFYCPWHPHKPMYKFDNDVYALLHLHNSKSTRSTDFDRFFICVKIRNCNPYSLLIYR